MDPVHDDLLGMLGAGVFEPYIRHIRFPRFRGLRDGTRINFDHPVTALVGPNGTNKTAILRALQGAPLNANLGQYWFSTNLDPIKAEDRHRFIYGYLAKSVGEVVEVVKSRIVRENDPDYFEPARPILQDGMSKMPPITKGTPMPADRVLTRWNPIRKNVVYLDFRSELSAYDKFFYHVPHRNDATLSEKKNHIRRRAIKLTQALLVKASSDTYFKRERIVKPYSSMTPAQVSAISTIIGRKYDSIDIIVHNYFDVVGATVVLKSYGLQYSEAFAGSGEFAVVMLVKAITEAEPNSLILLDEPEVSLHPGAQRQLMAFVARQAKAKRHQVVISTHSPAIVGELPASAIKVFLRNDTDGRVELLGQHTEPVDAFFRLGVDANTKWTVYVEDRLAVAIVKAAVRLLGEGPNSRLEVAVLPGGAGSIKSQFIPNLALTDRTRCLVMLDGDQRPNPPQAHPDTVPDGALEAAWNSACAVKITLPLDGSSAGAGSQKAQQLRKLLEWTYHNLDFLPGLNPETLLLDMEGSKNNPQNGKDVWVRRTAESLNLASWERPTAQDILQEQLRALGKIPDDCEAFVEIRKRVEAFLALYQ